MLNIKYDHLNIQSNIFLCKLWCIILDIKLSLPHFALKEKNHTCKNSLPRWKYAKQKATWYNAANSRWNISISYSFNIYHKIYKKYKFTNWLIIQIHLRTLRDRCYQIVGRPISIVLIWLPCGLVPPTHPPKSPTELRKAGRPNWQASID